MQNHSIKMRFLACLLALSGAMPLQAAPSSEAESCRAFVQSFYTWYVPANGREPNWSSLFGEKKSVFAPRLFQSLKADTDAQAKVDGEIVGLDFDPFLNSQDPSRKYVAGKISQKKDLYFVDIHSVSAGKKSAKPDLVAELKRIDGKWKFVNFHYGKSEYPENDNLVSVLKCLAETRANTK